MGSARLRLVVVALVALGAHAAAGQDSRPEVDAAAGKMRGKWARTESGRKMAAFEGIPFAQPPVGGLRFKSPQPMKPWTGVKEVSRVGSECLQRDIFTGHTKLSGSEDCLYLNVYTPETVSRSEPLPVMFYIHGGGFLSGGGARYGPERILEKDVVYVNFNYRLSALGFLSTGDDVIPGNFGLKDQVQALRWVRDNIRAFGGDPNLVTIFGESAGGASVHYLMLSPLSKGLFHHAVAMSGSAVAPWAFQTPDASKTSAAKVAEALGCPAEPSQALAECLAGKTGEDIQNTDISFFEWGMHPMVPFKPTAEPSGPEAFIDREPGQAMADGDSADVPFMTGFTSHEGCICAVPILENPKMTREYNDRFVELSRMMFFLRGLPEKATAEALRQVRDFYFGDKPISKDVTMAVVDLMTDSLFVYPTMETVKLQKSAAKSPVYLYQMAHRSDRSWSLMFGAKSASSYGVCHADDLLYLFPLRELFPQEPSESDKAFAKDMVDWFTTFAATGSPTSNGSWKPVQKAAKAEYAYLEDAGRLAMKEDFEPDRLALWSRLPVSIATAPPRVRAPKDEL